MAFPKTFLSRDNFRLAFTRVVRGANKDYKAYYRHLFPSYDLGLEDNLNDLLDDIRRGRYFARHGVVVHQPKRNGILRPLTLLSLQDVIVYQALMNYVAAQFEKDQLAYALKRSFGAVFSGRSSPFFYRSWKACYGEYNNALTRAYRAGNKYVADFDLVSFYELIDHNLLRKCLSKRVTSPEVLNLLFDCLNEWTLDRAGDHIGHGVPQGPEPSAFLAECYLLHFDQLKFKNIHYFRYVDDIKLLASDEVPLRRALMRLDLCSKDLGLVPQAQKIGCRKVTSLKDLLKNVPSALAAAAPGRLAKKTSQKQLLDMLRKSLRRNGKTLDICDNTSFKFALNRLGPRKDVLRRIALLLVHRPDCSWAMAQYLRKFPANEQAADILLRALQRDPTYDAAAANYINAMDVCEPESGYTKYRRVIQTANRRSEERSIQLRIASLTFRGRRASGLKAVGIVEREADPRVKSILIDRIFGDDPAAPFDVKPCLGLLEQATSDPDPDLARYAAAQILFCWPSSAKRWKPSGTVNRSVRLLLMSLGLRRRAPRKGGVLDAFFVDKMKIGIKVPWRRALGPDFRDAEQRCIRLQRLQLGDPSAWVLMLDTFNEVLLYAMARVHPSLKARFKLLSGKNHHPDIGAWLREPKLAAVVPARLQWWQEVHSTRVRADLAHAKAKKTGQRTRPVSFGTANRIRKRAQAAFAELLKEWMKVL